MEKIYEQDTEKLYQENINELIKISQMIDNSIEYNDDIRNDNVFLKLLFKDLRNGKKFYGKEQWKIIKTAIHNCYKLIQNGFVSANQNELKNNIIILNKLIQEPNLRIQSASEELVKNIFESSLKNLKLMEKEEKEFERRFRNFPFSNFNFNENKIYDKDLKQELDIEKKTYENKNFISKEVLEQRLNEEKNLYENKIKTMNNRINILETEINDMKNLISKIGKLFLSYEK